MACVVGVLNYGTAGNIFNISKAVEISGASVKVINNHKDFSNTDKIILPGVGSFNDAMEEIEKDGMKECLLEEIKNKHTLGICLGMQILTERGSEFGETTGLGVIKGEARKLSVKYKLPHMGWTTIETVSDSPLLNNIGEDDEFYFFHSLEVVSPMETLAFSRYSDYRFVAAISDNNHIFGVQFHPEKSRKQGVQVLKNFINL